MHFEILVEDTSGRIALTHFLDKSLGPDGDPHTRRVIAYKGIGLLPRILTEKQTPKRGYCCINYLHYCAGMGGRLKVTITRAAQRAPVAARLCAGAPAQPSYRWISDDGPPQAQQS